MNALLIMNVNHMFPLFLTDPQHTNEAGNTFVLKLIFK